GDAVSGTASAIQAIASGRKAAIAVDKFLGGSGRIDQKLAPEVEPGPRIGKREGFAAMTRSLLRNEVSRPARPGGRGFVLQQPPTSSDSCDGAYESERCLQCDLRLKIKTVKFWGNY
ncbi:MAG TPA: ferredoxin, partial [Thermoleophilia bacterium]|nr:ferredoxin [Thermoleophilia bacterium]